MESDTSSPRNAALPPFSGRSATQRTSCLGPFGCFKILRDPNDADLIEPYLQTHSPRIVSSVLWALCWIGAGDRCRDFIIKSATDLDLPWDEYGEVAKGALLAEGLYLQTHRDRELAQLIAQWAVRKSGSDLKIASISAFVGMAAGYAINADPEDLVDDDDYRDAALKRFLAERQDGRPLPQ